MPYNEILSARIRTILRSIPHLEEKKMFGGVGFLVNGNLACGVHKDDMIVRVGPEKYDAALARPHAHIFDFTGRPMAGWIMVDAQGCAREADLKSWVKQGLAFAHTLPAKGK